MLSIKNITTIEDIYHLCAFTAGDNPSYRDQYYDWLNHKLGPGLIIGNYKAKLAILGKEIIGSLIYRYLPNSLEIKCCRVYQDLRHLGLGKVLLSQVELLASERDIPLILDVSEQNENTKSFLQKYGFEIYGREKLYFPDQVELLLKKIPTYKQTSKLYNQLEYNYVYQRNVH